MSNSFMKNAYCIYKTKPFDGFQLGDEFAGRNMIAIPEKRLHKVLLIHKELCVVDKTKKELSYMLFKGNEVPLAFGEFTDKYGREGTYMLHYFEWKPIVQQVLFN